MVIFCTTGKTALCLAIAKHYFDNLDDWEFALGSDDTAESSGDTGITEFSDTQIEGDALASVITRMRMNCTNMGASMTIYTYGDWTVLDSITAKEVGLFDLDGNLLIRHVLTPSQAMVADDTCAAGFWLSWSIT